jgi:hypothetical protein
MEFLKFSVNAGPQVGKSIKSGAVNKKIISGKA